MHFKNRILTKKRVKSEKNGSFLCVCKLLYCRIICKYFKILRLLSSILKSFNEFMHSSYVKQKTCLWG
uniref:Uncharacterized protein n=1 Tax=Trichobilharzia regenti TaxID=157069 RepID=A0AA85J0B3_TRIRE|nr:unnamed protein product [Trichobilharzia regenti]